jgi:hypothetical protein
MAASERHASRSRLRNLLKTIGFLVPTDQFFHSMGSTDSHSD